MGAITDHAECGSQSSSQTHWTSRYCDRLVDQNWQESRVEGALQEFSKITHTWTALGRCSVQKILDAAKNVQERERRVERLEFGLGKYKMPVRTNELHQSGTFHPFQWFETRYTDNTHGLSREHAPLLDHCFTMFPADEGLDCYEGWDCWVAERERVNTCRRKRFDEVFRQCKPYCDQLDFAASRKIWVPADRRRSVHSKPFSVLCLHRSINTTPSRRRGDSEAGEAAEGKLPSST